MPMVFGGGYMLEKSADCELVLPNDNPKSVGDVCEWQYCV